ncbi:hypothetical protein NL108_011143 [Boleophthalmus pectinirostris]|uniref:tumor necrosis factor receptor superfamily member 26 n=1 Tax=Boleophthalmus pectinirostris TaxID=150288 RepID=UPI000A1C4531|nr:tumor necrosis factor receptor superfamily member 26 [Boleophthalmus pectinirostris]KAJ0066357.1 hypothetical protein NL108_011143 [Boleophthalmus pectinirostris]
MGLVRGLLLWLLAVTLVITSASTEMCRNGCKKCNPGEFQTNCACKPCPSNTYTSMMNCESSCHGCYSDCRADLHMKVVKNCTKTSDLRCECVEGFHCVAKDMVTGTCTRCQRTQPRVTPATARTTPCTSLKCSSESTSRNTTNHTTDKSSNLLVAILCPLLVIVGLCLVFLFCLGCPRHDTRFKQTVKKLCSVEVIDTAHLTRQISTEKQQTSPMATANMGPVHVHNPGTVIFSLLGDISGQIGETKEGKLKVRQPSGDEEYCTVCQPTPSPTLPLSEEEHPGEFSSTFFPSQEQGKDSHVSMEEQP